MTQSSSLLEEADFLIKDVGFAVKHISLSDQLKQANNLVYFNVVTNEDEKFTIQLSIEGFHVVAHDLNSEDGSSGKFPSTYETIYSLLSAISPSYTNSFSKKLSEKLSDLQNGV